MNRDVQTSDPCSGVRLALVYVLVLYPFLFFISVTLIGSGTLKFGVGDAQKAKQRIAHCQTRQEVRRELGKPTRGGRHDPTWVFVPAHGFPADSDALLVHFDAQDRVTEVTIRWAR
jgi:hypothetical protein